MFRVKKLTTDSELLFFADCYLHSFSERSKAAKRPLRMEELKFSNHVFAIYKREQIVAGFIVNNFPNRCLEEFSLDEQAQIVNKLGKENVCELVGIWKDARQKGAATTLFMWAAIIYKTLVVGKPYIFGCSRSEKVGKEYYYQADLQLIPNPHSELVVFYYTRKQFFMTFINSLVSFAKKKKNCAKTMKGKQAEEVA